jgi:hypothetical protein
MENKTYYKPYYSPIFYGHTKELSNKCWDEVWAYIDTLDLKPLIEKFSDQEVWDLMKYIEKEYPYSNELFSSLFAGISESSFIVFLESKFRNNVVVSELTKQIIQYRGDN